MNRNEHLLQCLTEECIEIAYDVSKALRFGLDDVKPGGRETNREKIENEIADLLGVVEMLVDEGIISDPREQTNAIQDKKQRLRHYMHYARQKGALS